jgi:hypothetical protein
MMLLTMMLLNCRMVSTVVVVVVVQVQVQVHVGVVGRRADDDDDDVCVEREPRDWCEVATAVDAWQSQSTTVSEAIQLLEKQQV